MSRMFLVGLVAMLSFSTFAGGDAYAESEKVAPEYYQDDLYYPLPAYSDLFVSQDCDIEYLPCTYFEMQIQPTPDAIQYRNQHMVGFWQP